MITRMTASWSSNECWTEPGQPQKEVAHDQEDDKDNDAFRLGAEGFPLRQIVNMFLMQSQNCNAGMSSILKPASSEFVSESALL